MVDGALHRQTSQINLSSKIFPMLHTRNLINLDDSRTGTISRVTIVEEQPALQTHKISEEEDLVEEVDETAIRHLEVELQARLPISMSRMSLVSLLWTTKLLHLVEVDFQGEGVMLGVVQAHMGPGAIREVVGAASMRDGAVSAGEGEAGETGIRYVQPQDPQF